MAKQFRWRLDPVRKVKAREEDRQQEALAEARRALQAEEARLADLVGQRADAVRQLQDRQQGALNTGDLAMRDAYVRALNERIQAQTEAVGAARAREQDRQEALVKAVQERKVLDNLRQRDHQRFRKEQQRKDQAATDETANRQSHGNRSTEE